MRTLWQLTITAVVALAVVVVALNVPANLFSVSKFLPQRLGAFTNISSTDNLADFPTTYNANLGLTIEVGTTSVASITTLSGLTTASSLATVGTITTGTWSADTLGVAFGGTGSTTLSQYSVLLGSTTNAISIVDGLGTSGQFLTSNGAGVKPSWQTSSVDQGIAYTWTAHHIFSSLFATNASSTNATTTNLTVTGNTIGIFPHATSTSFTASGTWVRPSGVDKVRVKVVGGGGGGGIGTESGGTVSGGGGGGGYCEAIITVTGNVTVTIGDAGTADGGTGGNSTFAGGVTATANGGAGGTAGSTGAVVAGGAGGTTSNCNVLGITGGKGENGNDVTDANVAGGKGGGNPLGEGGFGGDYDGNGDDGEVGSGYGAGGGGATAVNGSGAKIGAAGTGGVVIVYWYQTEDY